VLLSVYFASRWIRRNRRVAELQKLSQGTMSVIHARFDRSLTSGITVGVYTPSRCKPPQVVRWDLVGVGMSNLMGKMCGVPVPRLIRSPYYTFFGKRFRFGRFRVLCTDLSDQLQLVWLVLIWPK